MSTLLILSDDVSAAGELSRWAKAERYSCREFVDPGLFLDHAMTQEALETVTPDCVLLLSQNLDNALMGCIGMARARLPQAGLVVVAGRAADRDIALRTGADAHLEYGVDRDRLLVIIQQLMQLAVTRAELRYLRQRDASGAELGRLIGRCPAMREIFAQVRTICSRTVRARAAPAVLITGETGSGKGQIARAIHFNGTRRAQALVEINCAALPESLVEAELFGCERGAFTGSQSRPGLFEVAHHGTIFLDEIGALSLELQAKLLRVLDEGRVRRLGSTGERELDVQVIAATHRDLEAAIYLGEFREDLFFRLSVIHLQLPPLRERGEDVIALAKLIAQELCTQYGVPNKRFSDKTLKALRSYRWPGNIRELGNRLERIVLLDDTEVIEPHHLELPAHTVDTGRFSFRNGNLKIEFPDDGICLEKVEQKLIEMALEHSEGNITRAAKLLGLSRSTLRYRLKK